jgi:lipopolysaccharide transport system ATP-binding protein
MSDIAIEVSHLWKKFRRGEIHDSLRDLVPALARRFVGRGPKQENLGDGEFWALKDVGFQLSRGEIVGIIGSNGSGKSTLLKILSRILRPNSGFVRIHGRLSALIEVAAGFHPDLTGRENVYLNGSILGMKNSEVKRKFDEIVDFSEIEAFIDTPVKRYSSGMYLRLAFAVAAHLDPEVLLVDEVLAVGDARFQRKCLNRIQELGRRGGTILLVSHNLLAVSQLCERAIWLDRGSMLADGPSNQVVGSYMNPILSTTAAREWPDPATAPHGDVARLRAVRLRTEGDDIAEAADIRRAITIELEYEVLSSGWVLMPYHHVHNQEGVLLFSAHDLDPQWARRPRPEGRWVTSMQIPGNLLAEGMHFVSSGLLTLDSRPPQFYIRDALSFQIIEVPGERESSPARGGWLGPMGGVVRPVFKWRTEFSPDGSQAAAILSSQPDSWAIGQEQS